MNFNGDRPGEPPWVHAAIVLSGMDRGGDAQLLRAPRSSDSLSFSPGWHRRLLALLSSDDPDLDSECTSEKGH